jgi:hypothetical protein
MSSAKVTLKFSGELTLATPDTALRPVSSGLRSLMRSMGFTDQSRYLDRSLIFAKKGLHTVVGHHYKLAKKATSDPRAICRDIMTRLWGDVAQTKILSNACDEVQKMKPKTPDDNPQSMMENYIVSAIRSRMFHGSFQEAVGASETYIPESLHYIVEINADGSVQMGISCPQSLKSLTPFRDKVVDYRHHIPQVIAVKLWHILGSAILGGTFDKGLNAMVAVEPMSVLRMTVSQLPLEAAPQGGGDVQLIAKKDRASIPGGEFDTSYILRGIVAKSHPKAPHQYCVKCAERFGVLTFSPFNVGIDLLMMSECGFKVPRALEGTLKEEMKATKKSGLRLPFLDVQMPLATTCILARYVCGEDLSFRFGSCDLPDVVPTTFVEGFTTLLASAGIIEDYDVHFPFYRSSAVLLLTNPDEFQGTVEKLSPTHPMKSINGGNLARFLDFIHSTKLSDSALCDKSSKVVQAWESPRVDSRHHNSLSPFGFRRILPEGKSNDQKLNAIDSGAPPHKAVKAKNAMIEAVAELKDGIDIVRVPPPPKHDTNMVLLASEKSLSLADEDDKEGMPLGKIGGHGAFLLEDLFSSKLRGAFHMIGKSASSNFEFMVEGVMKYQFAGAMKVDMQSRGRVRILDKSGPMAVRMVNHELRVEGHIGLEDIRLFLILKESNDIGRRMSYSVDARVGSGQLAFEKEEKDAPIRSCWWGQGSKVTYANLLFIFKAFTDDTLIMPKLTDSSTFDAVRFVGSLENAVTGKGGTIIFYGLGKECFKLDVDSWFDDLAWHDFDKKCGVQYQVDSRVVDPLK